MVVLSHSDDSYARAIVTSAMERSFTAAQIENASYEQFCGKSQAVVLINPTDRELPILSHALEFRGKALVLGRVSQAVAEKLGLNIIDNGAPDPVWAAPISRSFCGQSGTSPTV